MTLITFKNIKPGETFIVEDHLYIRVKTTAKYRNAVSLVTGSLKTFKEDTLVIPVDTKFELSDRDISEFPAVEESQEEWVQLTLDMEDTE